MVYCQQQQFFKHLKNDWCIVQTGCSQPGHEYLKFSNSHTYSKIIQLKQTDCCLKECDKQHLSVRVGKLFQ
jgi:hypothetical protein